MTILYVDVEHEAVLRDPARVASHVAKLEVARGRLAAAAGEPCSVMRFHEVSPQQLAKLAPSAVILSGSITDWAEYEFELLQGLLEVIRNAPVPILGMCAGHQLIGYAHGASWGPLGSLREGEIDPDPRFAPGGRKERGFMPVEIDPRCVLFRGLGERAWFFQSHYWHLLEAPPGFVARARSGSSPIQVIERLDKPVFGVQFHPERFTAEHPDGDTLLHNFFAFGAR